MRTGSKERYRIPTGTMLAEVVIDTIDVGSSDADSVEGVEL